MAEDPKNNEPGTDPNAQQTQQNAGTNGNPGEGGLKDKFGQDAISKGKYERDLKAKDDEIANLTKQIEELKGDKSEIDKLLEEVEALKTDNANEKAARAKEKLEHELKEAGCIDVELGALAAKDYEDVAKLKEAKPHLFAAEKPAGKTGFKPATPPDEAQRKLDEARKLMGVVTKQ